MRVVELSWRESRLAAFAGVDRRLHALFKQCKDRNGAPSEDKGWQIDIEGVLGEWVLAKALDNYWYDKWPKDDGDVARLQVRATPLRNGSLIIHPEDSDDAAFVLVAGIPPVFTVPGWMAGRDAKQARWWREDAGVRTPAFFVPQQVLHPIEEFVT